ncbi:threonine-phosphate decarboxylase [Halobacteriales archaeon QS_8_65_32]|nr:MAG: threonine-phosphate decarboxylase [Halobacteriales archaeon QS_8_65_32]
MDPEATASVGRVPHGSSDDFDLLDFSANVNPRVPDGAREAYLEALDRARRYPPDDYPDYREAAAAHVGCEPAGVIPTPGGLAAIRLACEVVVEKGDSVLVPFPSFGEYAREVRLQGGTPEFVAHDALLDADPGDHALAIPCTPNNPTGDAYDTKELRAFANRCEGTDTALLVDEAFLGFTDRASLAADDHPENVVVARSLTKLFGLPGLRAGFAVARGDLRERLSNARQAWALGTPAALVGTHCLRDRAFVRETRRRVRTERARLRERLSAHADIWPSDAPFLLCDLGTECGNDGSEGSQRTAESVVAAAREEGIALRDATTFRRLDSHIRVAVRTPAENDRLVAVLDGILADE